MSISELNQQLELLKQELRSALALNKTEEISRIAVGISVIKDTIIEKYEEIYKKSNVRFIK